MTRYLVLSIRFLDGRYHGLTDNGSRGEWPPSPFRLFQALVAGSATGREIPARVSAALCWLEQLEPPIILVPDSLPGRPQLTYVLNNVESRSRTPKLAYPTLLDRDHLLRYIWTFEDSHPEAVAHASTISDAVRHIRALGWGIDLAVGCGWVDEKISITHEARVEYRPSAAGITGERDLRVPRSGSLQSLFDRYSAVLQRYQSPGVTDLEPSEAIYRLSAYTSRTARPCLIFALRTGDGALYQYPHAKLVHIAGMTRHAAIKAMSVCPPVGIKDTEAWVRSFVAGHGPGGADGHEQFSYIPLASIGHEHADAMIRRIMIAAPFGCEAQLAHLADQIDGVELEPRDAVEGPVLDRLVTDGVARRYLTASRAWASVTPVILPGHDDHKPAKTIKLIERALRQSRIDQPCEFTWSPLPNLKNSLAAHKHDQKGRPTGYIRPRYLESLTAVHVRLAFKHPVAGPLSIGAGRHCGLGVFAAAI